MPEIRYDATAGSESLFAERFSELDATAGAKVVRALARLEQGHISIILLTGGTKKRQQRDIDAAHAYWRDYKRDKRGRS